MSERAPGSGQDTPAAPLPIGGLLIILGVSILLTPLVITIEFWLSLLTTVDLHQSTIKLEIDFSKELAFLYLDILCHAIILILCFCLTYLFLNKSRSFPTRFLQVWILSYVYILTISLAACFLTEDTTFWDQTLLKLIAIDCVWGGFWTLYLFKAKRSKLTFIK